MCNVLEGTAINLDSSGRAFEFASEGITKLAKKKCRWERRTTKSAWRKCLSVLRQAADKLITRRGYNRDVFYKRIKGSTEFSTRSDLIAA